MANGPERKGRRDPSRGGGSAASGRQTSVAVGRSRVPCVRHEAAGVEALAWATGRHSQQKLEHVRWHHIGDG